MSAHEHNRGPGRLASAIDRGPVPYATVARGDVLDIDGRMRRIATIIQYRSGFTVQFTDTTTVRVLCPPDTCEIDGRIIRLEYIPIGCCLWCLSRRPLVPVGRYATQTNRAVTVYACTGCLSRLSLLPLAARTDTGTEVRRRLS